MRYFTSCLSIVLGSLALISVSTTGLALEVKYSDSVHGNTGYGVLRSTLNGVYVRGNCAHCHEQHTANADGYLLLSDNFSGATTTPYSSSDSACFSCHGGTTQSGTITNNDYSTTFGGWSATAPITSILDAFNQTSYHNLKDIKDYITGGTRPADFYDFSDKSSPCSGCHNIHLARANKRFTGNPEYTAISRPTDHENLWGDNDSTIEERLTGTNPYATIYQPLNHADSNLEPDTVSSDRATQAAKTPDYNSFCLDCHANAIYSNSVDGGARNLTAIDWSSEQHGLTASGSTSLRAPYLSASAGSYVLVCTDCHEPHGSSNIMLIRPSINGEATSIPSNSSANWRNLCARCHSSYHTPMQTCTNCHRHGGTF